jgi:hypothetical protein
MLYIITALQAEAQAFVDYYKLQPTSLRSYTLFSNEKIRLILSGSGVENTMFATQTLIDMYDLESEDIFMHVGVCSADESFEIGALIEIGTLYYHDKEYLIHSYLSQTLTCHDEEITQMQGTLVDSESFGFYEAIRHSIVIEKFHIFKVISTHKTAQKVTPKQTKSLLFNIIDGINKIIYPKEEL